MKARIHVITLAVADLDRALAFDRDGLGFRTEGLIGTKFTRLGEARRVQYRHPDLDFGAP